jgi:serine/threonine protein kinase
VKLCTTCSQLFDGELEFCPLDSTRLVATSGKADEPATEAAPITPTKTAKPARPPAPSRGVKAVPMPTSDEAPTGPRRPEPAAEPAVPMPTSGEAPTGPRRPKTAVKPAVPMPTSSEAPTGPPRPRRASPAAVPMPTSGEAPTGPRRPEPAAKPAVPMPTSGEAPTGPPRPRRASPAAVPMPTSGEAPTGPPRPRRASPAAVPMPTSGEAPTGPPQPRRTKTTTGPRRPATAEGADGPGTYRPKTSTSMARVAVRRVKGGVVEKQRGAERSTVSGEATEEAPRPPGTTLGDYRLLDLLSEGGMGRIYRAEHSRLGRKVALKLLHGEYAQDEATVARFFGEARAVNQICHENIIEITDFVENVGADNYYIMELLEGESLAERLERGPLPLAQARHIGQQIADALAAVHEGEIIHRDLKPDNVFLIERAGSANYVKLLDFGVAKLLAKHSIRSLAATTPGAVLGTPEYMSPEQASATTIDHRSDIYSLGLVLFEMVTGKKPFVGKNYGDLVVQRLTEDPPDPTTLRPDCPAELEALILDCLRREPEHRPQQVAEVASKLQALEFDTSPTAARPSDVPDEAADDARDARDAPSDHAASDERAKEQTDAAPITAAAAPSATKTTGDPPPRVIAAPLREPEQEFMIASGRADSLPALSAADQPRAANNGGRQDITAATLAASPRDTVSTRRPLRPLTLAVGGIVIALLLVGSALVIRALTRDSDDDKPLVLPPETDDPPPSAADARPLDAQAADAGFDGVTATSPQTGAKTGSAAGIKAGSRKPSVRLRRRGPRPKLEGAKPKGAKPKGHKTKPKGHKTKPKGDKTKPKGDKTKPKGDKAIGEGKTLNPFGK